MYTMVISQIRSLIIQIQSHQNIIFFFSLGRYRIPIFIEISHHLNTYVRVYPHRKLNTRRAHVWNIPQYRVHCRRVSYFVHTHKHHTNSDCPLNGREGVTSMQMSSIQILAQRTRVRDAYYLFIIRR